MTTRWKFFDPALLYLFPLTYCAHVAEEWFATAPIVLWTVHLTRPIQPATFVVANAIGLVLMLVGVRVVARGSRFHWIVPALACAVLLNTAGHLVGSIGSRVYSAGLMTSIVLWVPLGLLTMVRVWDQANRKTIVAGAIVGATIELIVTLTARTIG